LNLSLTNLAEMLVYILTPDDTETFEII